MGYFNVVKLIKGNWAVTVSFDDYLFYRRAKDKSEAKQLLACLKHNLVTRQGPTIPTLEQWHAGKLCRKGKDY